MTPSPDFLYGSYNATTGQLEFTLNGGVAPSGISNDYIISVGQLDGVDYCIVKGQTSTLVTAPIRAVPEGTAVLIKVMFWINLQHSLILQRYLTQA